MIKIRIGLPLPNGIDLLDTAAFQSVQRLSQRNDLAFDFFCTRSALVGENRDRCVSDLTAVEQTNFDFDYFLSVDADIEFNNEHIDQLLSDNNDVVSGAYLNKMESNQIHAGFWGQCPGLKGDAIHKDSKGLIECDWIGAGFMLIKKRVFQELPHPWFAELAKVCYIQNNVPCAIVISEAFTFCLKAKHFKICVDCDCKVQHV